MALWSGLTGTTTSSVGTSVQGLATSAAANTFQATVDLTAMVNGDITEIALHRIINSTNTRREALGIYSNVQANPLAVHRLIASQGLGVVLSLRQTAGTARAYPWELLNDGSAMPVNVTQWGSTNVSGTAGIPDVNVKNINNVAAATPGAAGGIFIAGTNAATTVTTAFTTTFTGNLTGSVGSVTGNVGGNVVGTVASVVGNVGGNVTGSVGSVVGAVGSVTGAVGSVTGNVGGNVVGTVASVVGNVGGNVTGSVGSVAIDGITNTSLAASAITEIQAGLATSAALTTVDSNVSAIKTKTDSLTFTVAGQVDSNIQYVNDVQVTGNGQSGNEWGPV